MSTRAAACHCGQLRLEVAGDRSPSPSATVLPANAGPEAPSGCRPDSKRIKCRSPVALATTPESRTRRTERSTSSTSAPTAARRVFYTEPTEPDLIVVSVGSFADPSFPPPTESGYDSRRHHWVGLPDSIQRHAPELWDEVRPLLDAGRYAEAADRGRELIEARPDQGYLYYNVACCESLAGETADAVEHLRQAIDIWEGCRERKRTRTSIRSGTSPLSRS